MCLVKVKQEEDVVVPYRVVQRRRSPSPRRRASHTSVRRYSRDEIVRESNPRYSNSASYIAVPTPKPLAIPAPQPVPIFVQPPPAPIPAPPPSHVPSHHHHQHQQHHHHHNRHSAHLVEVSPRSSVTSDTSSPGRSEYVYREREVRRERAYSPESNPRYEHFRYVEAAPSESDGYDRYERRESRSRHRSRSRGYNDDPRGSYRETTARVSISDDHGQRREYRR